MLSSHSDGAGYYGSWAETTCGTSTWEVERRKWLKGLTQGPDGKAETTKGHPRQGEERGLYNVVGGTENQTA